MTEAIIGLVALPFFFLCLAWLIPEQHLLLKIISIFFAVWAMLGASSFSYGQQDYCDIVRMNETVTAANITTFQYDRLCFNNTTPSSAGTAIKLTNYFNRILYVYGFFAVLYYLFYVQINEMLKKFQEMFR